LIDGVWQCFDDHSYLRENIPPISASRTAVQWLNR
jgi:hypothetical protein